jgi:hypothetical protein
MKNNDLIEELSYLELERRKTLRIINSMYYMNSKVRSQQFQKLDKLDELIKKVKFKIRLLKERKKCSK